MKKLISVNPAKNFEKLGEIEVSSDDEIRAKVKLANNSKNAWKKLKTYERIRLLKDIYDEFESRKQELALIITSEIGKPITESREEIDRGLNDFVFYLEHGEEYLKDEVTCQNNGLTDKIVYEPWGVAAVILPWNYPFWLFIRRVIPNLIAGNTVVLKHSEYCPLCAKFISYVMDSKNLPSGVFSQVFGNGKQGDCLVSQEINIICFTGSSAVGRDLYEIAGKRFIKAVLEMGDSNPAIVFEDVNINEVAEKIYNKRFRNCGQYCNAVKRLVIHESIFDYVIEKLKQLIESKIVGDPADEKTEIGSMASKKHHETLLSQVKNATSKGAKIVTGGNMPEGFNGVYYLPTLLINVTRNMKVWNEEVFGPVLPAIPFRTEEEAIELANNTDYGLGALIYSKDKERALRVASNIGAGMIDINQGNGSKLCNPFGGYKISGMGREQGKHGFRELCQIKLISEA